MRYQSNKNGLTRFINPDKASNATSSCCCWNQINFLEILPPINSCALPFSHKTNQIITFASSTFSILKRNQITNFIGLLLILLCISVVGIGYITYNNLNEIVAGLKEDSNPSDNLIRYKEIMISISNMETKMEGYRLTGEEGYLKQYDRSVVIIFETLDLLNRNNNSDKELITLNDSLANLLIRKTELLNDILELSLISLQTDFKPLERKIDDLTDIKIINDLNPPQDTTQTEETAEKKKGFLKKLFKKKNKSTTTEEKPVNTDSIYLAQAQHHQNRLKNTITQIRLKNLKKLEELEAKEVQLQTIHDEVQETILELISRLESREGIKVEISSLRAQDLAYRTNQRITIFSALTFLLLLATITILTSYFQKNKKYQQLLHESKESTEALANAKELFFANMSHEIRTPMNAISGFSRLLLKSDLNAEQRDQVEIIDKSSDHLLKLLNDILDFSKLQALKLQLERKSFHLKELLNDAYQLLREPANDKGLEFKQTFIDLPTYVCGDPYRLKQILINLLNNSIKFTDQGKVELQVTATNKANKSAIKIAVIDTGRGIPKESQPRLFQEFEQSDQSSFSKGTGLGLAITKRLVELHDGNIKLSSEEGDGTTVTVWIDYEISQKPQHEQTTTMSPTNLNGVKFLIADDEPFNIKLLTTLLDKRNGSYDTATDGNQAFELLKTHPYDVILLDLKMPGMTGWELAHAIRKTNNPNQHQPIIALTATVAQIEHQKVKSSGFNYILRKPFDEKELFAIISKSELKVRAEQSAPTKENGEVDLSSLEKMGDELFVIDMVNTFIQSATKEWKKIELAWETGDLPSIANSAHKVVAPARHLKASKLVALLKEMEQTAESGNQVSKNQMELTQTELYQVIGNLQDYLENKPTLE